MKKRYIKDNIINDLKKKLVILSGPRQVGKTTLAENIIKNFEYFNYDFAEHRIALKEKSWDRKKQLIVFDELHKMKKWKSWLKGIYDVEGINPAILVTGSAKLDVRKKMGDSLAGRFFSYRLHPFDIKEMKRYFKPEKILEKLLAFGGFPEPFLENDSVFYARWRRSHIDIILRQDLIELETVKNIKSIETLIELLRYRVGSPVSYASLARDLEHDSKTVKRWLAILENLYIIFSITPYHKNIARSLLKEPKYYFYDTAQVKGDNGCKLENIVACALLKEKHFQEDVLGKEVKMHFLRNKDGKEIDFIILSGEKVYLIEVKLSDDNLSSNYKAFEAYFPNAYKIQLVKDIKREKTFSKTTEIRKAANWLADFVL